MLPEPATTERGHSGITSFTRHYWTFLFAENLYDIGLYIFVLLYNLYLLDLGYREDFLGWVTSAMSIGSIAGALPAAAIARRLGLKRTVIFGSAGVAVLCMCRTAALSHAWLMGTAFFAGAISSVWAVSLVPTVAALTTEGNRALGYSLWTGWGIGLGVIMGAVAGSMTGWIRSSGFASSDISARQIALLIGSATALLSPLLLVHLPLAKSGTAGAKVFPRSPFVMRFLVAYAVWNVGVGAFNPFFTAYFSRQLHMSTERIGFTFSAAQLAELCALLLAPMMLRRFGNIRGIALMQAGVALSLALLSIGPPAIAAGAIYALFGSFQYMSEPATFTLLMSRVSEDERAGASSLSFFITSAAQAASAAVAGVSIVRFGYRPLLTFASLTTALAAWLFYCLLGESKEKEPGRAANANRT
ncbi:MAG TPA: MFS transporter [Bryobacteraceae bacterium]|nr:MFS transporter [Bryobacteraceae bacterium]